MTPPASTEPMHCEYECVCRYYYEGKRSGSAEPCDKSCHHDTRARDSVVRQAPSPIPHEQKDGECTFGQSYGKCSDYQTCEECMENEPTWLELHDAALIAEDRKRHRPPCEECIYQAQAAQEREKWEQEHTPIFHAENPDVFSPWYNVEMVAARVQAAKAQAREDVLDEPHINQYLERIRKSSIALKDEKLKTIISVALSIAADHYESLRHGQKQECEPE